HPDKLAVQTRYLAENPDVAMLAGRIIHINGQKPECKPLNGHHVTQRLPLEKLVIRACFQTSSVLVRKQCLDEIGLFDTTLKTAEDRDLWIRLGARYGVHLMETI